MSNHTPQDKLSHELSQFFKRFTKGGDLAPIEARFLNPGEVNDDDFVAFPL